MFTQRHFIAIANMLKREKPEATNQIENVTALAQWTNIVDSFCAMFESDNPRFNKTRFLVACNYP